MRQTLLKTQSGVEGSKVSTFAASLPVASWRTVFGIDLRTLALFRILLGSYILLDLLLRARDLTAHYTEFGVMPREVQLGCLADWSWSIHLLNGSALFQASLFALAGFVWPSA